MSCPIEYTKFFFSSQEIIAKKMLNDITSNKYDKELFWIPVNKILRIPIGWFIKDNKIYMLLVSKNNVLLEQAMNNEIYIMMKTIYRWLKLYHETYFKDWIDYSNYDPLNDKFIQVSHQYLITPPRIETFSEVPSCDNYNSFEDDPIPIHENRKRRRS